MKSPWRIQIVNGKGVKVQNQKGGSYMKSGSFLSEKNAFIQLTDMDLYTLLKRTDSYITNWEACMAPSLIANGKQAYEKQQQDWQSQNQGQDQGYAQNGQYQGQAQKYSQNSQYQDQTQNYTQNGQYQGQAQNYAQNRQYQGQNQTYAQHGQYQNPAQSSSYAA